MPAHSMRSPELEAEILRRIATGEPVAVICRDPGMPHPTTWCDWLVADEKLRIACARAREAGHDAIAADALLIADDDSRDWEAIKDDAGNVTGIRVDGEHVQRSKLRVETRLKLLAKWDPKRYGENHRVALTDPDGNPLMVLLQQMGASQFPVQPPKPDDE